MIKLGGINGNHSGHILETETIRLTDDFNPELNHHHILKHFQSIFSLGFSLTSLSLHHFFFFSWFLLISLTSAFWNVSRLNSLFIHHHFPVS